MNIKFIHLFPAQNNGRGRGQLTVSRIDGFPFIDGPITRPRPRPRPRPGLLRRMTLQQILSGSPSYLPWPLRCAKITYRTFTYRLLVTALRLRWKISILWDSSSCYLMCLYFYWCIKQSKGGIDTFHFITNDNYTLKCIMKIMKIQNVYI